MKLLQTLNMIGNRPYNINFANALVQNKKRAKVIIEELQKDIYNLRKSKDYAEMLKGLDALKEKMCERDDSGNPVFLTDPDGNKNYKFPDEKAFDKAVDDYYEEERNKKVLEKEKKLTEKYNNNLEKDVEFVFYVVDESFIPETIEANVLEVISPMIVETPQVGKSNIIL